MKTKNINRQPFIREMIIHGNRRRTNHVAYSECIPDLSAYKIPGRPVEQFRYSHVHREKP